MADDKVLVSRFDKARIEALDSYAMLEMTISMLMVNLLGIALDVGQMIFYRITNTRSRYAIMDDLFRRKDGGAYRKFWASLESELVKIDQRRNNLIHWVASSEINTDTGFSGNEAMRPQHKHFADAELSKIDLDELERFAATCKRLTAVTSFLLAGLNPMMGESERQSLLDIYREPLDGRTQARAEQVLFRAKP